MTRTYGTLEVLRKNNNKFWKIRGPQAVIMIRRIIHSSGYDEEGCAIIPHNKMNVDYIEWLMQRFPLEIKANGEWTKAVEDLHEMKSKMEKVRTLTYAKPSPKLNGKLFEFQKQGLDFLLKTSGNGLLADEMGLGKSLQSLAYVATDKDTMPVLIVAPVVTLWNWRDEINKWLSHKIKTGPFKGNELSPKTVIIRKGEAKELPVADFYITNYDILYKRVEDLARTGIQTLIADEVQNIRNTDTLKYKGVKEISELETIKHKIALSGTPIYNHGSEIWPIVDMIQAGRLGTYNEFTKTYCTMDYRGRYIVDADKTDALAELLSDGIMLRRKKMDVLKDLKEKIKYKEVIETETDVYDAELEKLYKEMEEKKKNAKTHFDQIRAMQDLKTNERKIAGMAKLPWVIKFVHDMMELEEPIVVFCHHIAVHEALNEHLEEFKPCSIIGGQTDNQRLENIRRFKEGESKLMIAGLRAGNVGINLTNASYVIHAELDWTPAIHMQAEDRLHRIGQQNTVLSYYLIGRGTLDDKVADVLVDKKLEIDAILGDKESEDDPAKAEAIINEIQNRLEKKKS